MKSIINTISRVFMIAIMSISSIATAFAHPGHGVLNPEGEGVEHFISSPYHIAAAVLVTIVLAVVFIKYRKAIVLLFSRSKK